MPDKGGASLSSKKRRKIADRTESYIIKHLPDFIGKLEELAMGITIQKVDGRTGEINIYTRPPDRQALEFLIEHGLGKVPQRHELTGGEGGPLEIIPWAPPSTPVGNTGGPLPALEGEVIDATAWRPTQEEEEVKAEEVG